MNSQNKSLIPTVAAALVLLAVLLVPSSADKPELTCGTVASSLAPCHAYLKAKSEAPQDHCCEGANALFAACNTTELRQTACFCMMKLAKGFEVVLTKVQNIPVICGIPIPVKIIADLDCSTVP